MVVSEETQGRLAIGFACLAHFMMHVLSALYLTLVLVLEVEWRADYDALLRLWTAGSLLIGLAAPLAGWLGDRWSNNAMIALFFLVTGAGAVLAGLSGDQTGLWLGLMVVGVGSSIAHPVAMSVIARTAVNRGRSMGWFSTFGTVGVALAGVIAGGLADQAGWRAAFIVPGAVSIALGLVLAIARLGGWVVDRAADAKPEPAVSRGDVMRAFVILSVTMVCAGMMYNGLQLVLPKLFKTELSDWLGNGFLGVGGLVTAVNLSATIPQMIGGHLADRMALKRIYLISLLSQTVMMAILAAFSGLVVAGAAALVVMVMQFQGPAENLLLARYTPGNRRGLIFGARFVLVLGIVPVSVQVVTFVHERFGAFGPLYLGLAGFGLIAVAATQLLPDDRPRPVAVPAPGGVPAGD